MILDLGFTTFNTQQIILTIEAFFFNQPPGMVALKLLVMGGWLVVAWLFLFMGLYLLTNDYKAGKFQKKWKWVLLAIDVPQLNVQTPKAVEQMFAHLAGALNSPNIAEKYHEGFKQRWFSFEIISIGGYIQFLVRTEEKFRDLVEASVYAQYPEVEITEVEDYVTDAPDTFPNENFEMWGADFGLAEDSAYPIRTYAEFEHNISKDTVLKDPMGTFLESFSRIGPGEQMWFQINVEPISNTWKEKGIKLIKGLIGEKVVHKASGFGVFLEYLISPFVWIINGFGEQIVGGIFGGAGEAKPESKDPQNKLQFLTPGQKTVVEHIEQKISKIGFKTKMRGIYLARKEVFNSSRGVSALLGAVKQFNILNENSIVPKYGVSASYFMKDQRTAQRKTIVMKAYKKRKIGMPATPCIMNIEELATIWHFPMSHVRTPLLQKSGAKASEPPAGLPIDEMDIMTPPEPITNRQIEENFLTDVNGKYKEEQKFG